jgi:hypothetical protein
VDVSMPHPTDDDGVVSRDANDDARNAIASRTTTTTMTGIVIRMRE